MSFQYQNFTISGSRDEIEGTSEFVTRLRNSMESAGWVIEDDRRTQAGSATDADTHKIVMKSEGEDDSLSTFYLTIASGVSSVQNSNVVSFMMSTGYDVGTHDVPSSDAKIPANLGGSDFLNTRTSQDYEIWMSGDSEGVVFITRQSPATYASCYIGRCNQFTSIALDPHPLYIVAGNTTLVTKSTSAKVIAGNPPEAAAAVSEGESIGISYTAADQPYTGVHTSVNSIFVATPLVITMDDAAPSIRKGMVGTVRNAWQAAGTTSDMLAEGTLTASGSFGVQIYRAFPVSTVSSLIIRQS